MFHLSISVPTDLRFNIDKVWLSVWGSNKSECASCQSTCIQTTAVSHEGFNDAKEPDYLTWNVYIPVMAVYSKSNDKLFSKSTSVLDML